MLTVRDSQIREMVDATPNTPMVQPCPADQTWIEFCLVDRDNYPVPGEPYNVRLPDQSLMTGNLDSNGKVRFDGIVAGQASICFPGIDKNEWNPIGDAAHVGGGDSTAYSGSDDSTASRGSSGSAASGGSSGSVSGDSGNSVASDDGTP